MSLLALAGGCGGAEPGPPDLVLITTDALAAHELACFGATTNAGAALCSLSEGGSRFAWAAARGEGEASGAASLLTGRSREEHGLIDDGIRFLASENTTIAERLLRAGYRTAAFVTSPRINRSRRLDQGFEVFDDHLAAPERTSSAQSVALAKRVQGWWTSQTAPRFVWIHLAPPEPTAPDAVVAELDRLVSRLSALLGRASDGPGILFAATRGASKTQDPTVTQGIAWTSHRVPLFWRPPAREAGPLPPVSAQLASLTDVAVTLGRAAGLPAAAFAGRTGQESAFAGRDLTLLARLPLRETLHQDRFVLLSAPHSMTPRKTAAETATLAADSTRNRIGEDVQAAPRATPELGEVGLASQNHLYVRRREPGDGSGRPVPVAELVHAAARFASVHQSDAPGPIVDAFPTTWRKDVLSSESPASRLEFHLARQLGGPTSRERP